MKISHLLERRMLWQSGHRILQILHGWKVSNVKNSVIFCPWTQLPFLQTVSLCFKICLRSWISFLFFIEEANHCGHPLMVCELGALHCSSRFVLFGFRPWWGDLRWCSEGQLWLQYRYYMSSSFLFNFVAWCVKQFQWQCTSSLILVSFCNLLLVLLPNLNKCCFRL